MNEGTKCVTNGLRICKCGGGKWGGGVMIWEIGIDVNTVMCIKWMNNKKK